ncbi:hypothetical protein EKO29_13725 [Colwellia sp. Arc7-635]|jgi:hypothetical protein|uniref:hypothetical protein n=1 Tax=Colwellia sp. Arc7-635 TaxID=2497879 RepID=UPI000F851483|nr:hypothetical protein [Colwellia sp. Arc7-635]AZQ84952.1 hypothetical protein EKO29_13725 [Colwellia sp. Arc7-635]
MDEQQFDRLKKVSAKSFNDQKALIKKVLAGRDMPCQQCGTSIRVVLPEDKATTGLYCAKGCTNIALDFVL